MMRKEPFLVLIFLLALLLTGCGINVPLSTAVVTPTATPTSTPIPSATPVPPPTATPEAPPTSEATSTPEVTVFAAPVTGIWPATADGSLSLWPAEGPFDGEPAVVAPPTSFSPLAAKLAVCKKSEVKSFY